MPGNGNKRLAFQAACALFKLLLRLPIDGPAWLASIRLKTDIRYTALADFFFQSATIKQETFVEIEPRAPLSLDSIREEFHLLEDLLLLLADVDVVLPWPTVRYGSEAGVYYFERRRSDPQKVDILKSWAALKWQTTNLGTLLSSLEAQQPT